MASHDDAVADAPPLSLSTRTPRTTRPQAPLQQEVIRSRNSTKESYIDDYIKDKPPDEGRTYIEYNMLVEAEMMRDRTIAAEKSSK